MIPRRYKYGETCGSSFFSSQKTSKEMLLNYESRNKKSRQLYFKKHFDDRKICTNQSCQRHSTDLRRHFDVKTCAFGLFAIEKLSKEITRFYRNRKQEKRQLFCKQHLKWYKNCKTISYRVESFISRRP